MKRKKYLLTDKQLENELKKCEYCEERPCEGACPVNCSPYDFIMAARQGEPQDILRSASLIMKNNPLGEVCGMVCPEKHCMAKCSHQEFDGAVKIPQVQATIVNKAKELGGIPEFVKPVPNGKKVAIIGSGPAGLGAASVLAQKGYSVDIYERGTKPGGICNLIPDNRLPQKVLKTDIQFLISLGNINFKFKKKIDDVSILMKSYDGVLIAVGLWKPIMPGIKNENIAINSIDYLSFPKKYKLRGTVAVIGGGATALDCAVTAKLNGANKVELFALEKLSEMPLTTREREELLEYDIQVSGRTRVISIRKEGKKIKGLRNIKIRLMGKKFDLKKLKDIQGTESTRNDISYLIIAIGNRPDMPDWKSRKGVFFTGDCVNGPTTVVEAVAAGKNTAELVDAYIMKRKKPVIKKKVKSIISLPGYVHTPIPLETEFFGRRISTPFLLSASPVSDGYDQMKKAYQTGWSGGIMKTAFDNVPIHIPSQYMHVFDRLTYGNCDNVSGHALDRVCSEVEKLVKEYPYKLTIASTGGPVTGNDENDMKVWQSNTKKLEDAGAMAIEYSLSCPQGGDGTEGDIVSQNPALTAKIIDWIMSISNPNVPKLFKLTPAVTAINVIINAVKKVLEKYPGKKAGVTLANSFPSLGFESRGREPWENGVVLGMSGEGIAPITYFSLARAVPIGVEISGNGGPMNYKQVAHFLALGVKTVQLCSIVMKYGYGIFNELCNGVSYLMKQRGINRMEQLIAIAQPDVITDFMDLSPTKMISSVDKYLCVSCGNCQRCPYQAIKLNKKGIPETDAGKCIGCSFCTKTCFVGALEMRDRTPEELAQLSEK